MFWVATIIIQNCFYSLGMEFTRASQGATGMLFHSSMTTSRSWQIFETLHTSTFRLRIPQRCSIGFKSGDILGQLYLFCKAMVVLEVCLESLSCWNTALLPSFWREGSFSAAVFHSTCWSLCFPQWNITLQHLQHSCSLRPWHSHHHAWLKAWNTYLCTPHLVAATHAWSHQNQTN